MPSSHLTAGDIDRYVRRSLAPADFLAMEDHLETCAECRGAREAACLAAPVFAALPADAPPIHLTEEEMARYAAGRLDSATRRQCAEHLSQCVECRADVAAMEDAPMRDVASAPPFRQVLRAPWLMAAAALLLAALPALWWAVSRDTAPRPALLASLMDGGRPIELNSAGELRGAEGWPPEYQAWAREALTKGALPVVPAGVALTRSGLRSAAPEAAGAFIALAPVGVRVLDALPRFTWRDAESAPAYEVVVTDENLSPVARSGRISGTEWSPTQPLPRGVPLLWQVRAYRKGAPSFAPAPPDPPARFEIVSQEAAQTIETLRSSPHPSHLLLAVAYARAGLTDEAASEMAALKRENPSSAVVGKLSESLK